MDLLRQFPNQYEKVSSNFFSRLTDWENFKSLVGALNPNFTVAYEYGYYSSHTVCLPTFFPDPTKDPAWGYSFLLLLLNFSAFIFMLIAYSVMYK